MINDHIKTDRILFGLFFMYACRVFYGLNTRSTPLITRTSKGRSS